MKATTGLYPEDIDTSTFLSYSSYCIEHDGLEITVKFVSQLKEESRRVAEDWLKEAWRTLGTKQLVKILTA